MLNISEIQPFTDRKTCAASFTLSPHSLVILELLANSPLICVFEEPAVSKNWLRYHVRFQDDSMTALVSANMIDSRSVLILVVVLVCGRIVELVVGHPRPLRVRAPIVPVVSLPGPTGVLRYPSRMASEAERQPSLWWLES